MSQTSNTKLLMVTVTMRRYLLEAKAKQKQNINIRDILYRGIMLLMLPMACKGFNRLLHQHLMALCIPLLLQLSL